MPEVEKKPQNNFEMETALTALIGFILSVFLILISLIILVRFWAFENILYNLFVLCYFVVGVVLNISSVNIMLHEYVESAHVMPFAVAIPISLFWTIFCIIMPFFTKNFFSQFAQLPIATYDSSFYDGLGYNPDSTTIHPFAKPFVNESSIFNNAPLLILLLIILGRK